MIRRSLSLCLLALMTVSMSACSNGEESVNASANVSAKAATEQRASPPASAVNGEGFVRIAQPVRTSDPDKIEVSEVFWYGCSHCFDFEPMVHAWSKQLPDDVVFVPSPAMWNDLMVLHAQAFYTAKALNILDQVHQPLFDEINLKKNPLRDRDAIEQVFLAHSNVSAETFRKTFDSFGVKSQVRQADARARSYGIAGTPELIVNGKYRVTGRAAGSKANMLKVAEQLIEQERAAR
ncbi:thiol:disulfide interchange protein DsbA/DsbL [Spongiibacter sp.]|uniref:thiol:disulfide interchange protein DsbA/DsbL n=1 Tax=Spongiibacter sp. TaxID=2024860 RepID=UPI00356408F1